MHCGLVGPGRTSGAYEGMKAFTFDVLVNQVRGQHRVTHTHTTG